MTEFKFSSKFKLFAIICALIIAVGMAMGTVGHFIWNGFFNFGDEFAAYKSVVVRYAAAEYSEDDVKPVCEEALAGLGSYTLSSAQALSGGELVYKFGANTDRAKLEEAAQKINGELNKLEGDDLADLNVASVREGDVNAGGSKALIFASIALSSAVALAFIYYIFRYKLRAACTMLLACIVNLGLFVSLLALTRLPVGAEIIALSALVVLITALGCGVFFDRVRKNFKNENYAKSDRVEVIDISARESVKINVTTAVAIAVVALVFGVFASVAAMSVSQFIIAPIVILGGVAACFGTVFFTPAVYVKADAVCEKLKRERKEKKAEGKNQPAASEKAQA